MRKKQYASSVYSQKSTTSAKSGKSFLSLAILFPSKEATTFPRQQQTDEESLLSSSKQSRWQNILKNWKWKDSDSISSSSSVSSKLKQLFVTTKKRNSVAKEEEEEASSYDAVKEKDLNSSILSTQQQYPTITSGILINRGQDSEEAIAERKRRRHQRRENILKLQQQQQHNHSFYYLQQEQSFVNDTSSSSLSSDIHYYTTTTTTTAAAAAEDGCWGFNPRIMFVEPSPVPRFRNVAPPPPPSPPYLNIIVHKEDPNEECIIQSPAFEDDPFTIFASTKTIHHPTPLPNTEVFNYNKHLSIEEHNTTDEQRMSLLIETLKSTIKQPKPRIYFHPPFQRGQTARLTLRNTMPEDHVIIFKFLTTHQGLKKTSGERYFVKPSAGKFSTDQLDIRVFLNQIPTELIKDELIIRWAIIQRHTEIEDWANKTLHDSNRRQWIDLLDERWPGQVIVRLTRIKIRFNNTEEMIA